MLTRILCILERIRFCRSPHGLPPGTIVLFPVSRTRLCCGLAGIVEVVRGGDGEAPDLSPGEHAVTGLSENGLASHPAGGEGYAGGEDALAAIERMVVDLRRPEAFPPLYREADLRERLAQLSAEIGTFVFEQGGLLESGEDLPSLAAQEEVNRRLVRLKDASWAVDEELLANVAKVRDLVGEGEPTTKALREYRKANLILNSIDRLEIRGRDSAGILFQASFPDADRLAAVLDAHAGEVSSRKDLPDFPDRALSVSHDGRTATLVFKVAAEVGALGDNVSALRESVTGDPLLDGLLSAEDSHVLVVAHTRWASNGIINLANCHPLDNAGGDEPIPPGLPEEHDEAGRVPRIHVALNGDIDNYLDLKRRFEEEDGRSISERITTDAKIISLWVDHYLRRGESLKEAFRMAVRDFEGSAAILMTSDLEPGRLYVSLKGSGQSLYVGLASAGTFVASEIYGLVEETDRFVKLEGEKERVPGDATTRGQVFILDPDAPPGHEGVGACHHDGVPVSLAEDDVRRAEITTRDVDRGDFAHYFLKEVSQAPESVAKTLRGKFSPDGRSRFGPETVPDDVIRMIEEGTLDRIAVVGQGTAAVAAMAVGAFIAESLRGSGIVVESMKASELSGFGLDPDMSRTLIVPVTQSGATADTNRAVDLARERGAHSIAIVNRRNSDITFKTSGVLYTSDGRDVEMSVASTKAFYSQVVAGALLGLAFGLKTGTLTENRVLRQLTDLRDLPRLLHEVFDMRPAIARAAQELAPTRRYWAVVGSGPNRIAAEEVRIKLSELCYKSISSDSVEDKKHIDLSSEPLILVLAAGNAEAVLSDLAKDVAIFKAHRALPVVFAFEGDRRFDEYAASVIRLPICSPLLSMITVTMAGHLFGYFAARAIDDGAKFLGRIRSVVVGALDHPFTSGLSDIGRSRREFRQLLHADRFSSAMEVATAADLMLLLKYAAGEIPPATFPEEYERPAGQEQILGTLLERLVDAIDETKRPIDAIKHQAKIVTVGTSRPSERPVGVVFDALSEVGVPHSSIPVAARALLQDAQIAVRETTGVTRYAVEGLPPDGVPDQGTQIRVTDRVGAAASIESRAEGGAALKGTKRSVVRARNAYVGVGAKDGRKIAIVPIVDHHFHVTALVLLHLTFRQGMSVEEKRRALGERYDEVVNGVTEADVAWSDDLLEPVSPEDVVTKPPDRLAEQLVGAARGA
ncbi:MAG: SIS domain-containing protein [Planctomycetota bacterium]|jgi:glucosamine--fructose-6-phosphate aminotransferase (isomerizing)